MAPPIAGESALWLRSISSPTDQKLPRTDGALSPFWSPDGRSIGFITWEKGVQRIDLTGNGPSPPQTITPVASNYAGAAWSKLGVVYPLNGPNLTYSYDGKGRPLKLTDAGTQQDLITGATYARVVVDSHSWRPIVCACATLQLRSPSTRFASPWRSAYAPTSDGPPSSKYAEQISCRKVCAQSRNLAG
jgi:hypothetical protein